MSKGPQVSLKTPPATEIVLRFDGESLRVAPEVADMIERGRISFTVVRWSGRWPTRKDYRTQQGAENDLKRAMRDGVHATLEVDWKTTLKARS